MAQAANFPKPGFSYGRYGKDLDLSKLALTIEIRISLLPHILTPFT